MNKNEENKTKISYLDKNSTDDLTAKGRQINIASQDKFRAPNESPIEKPSQKLNQEIEVIGIILNDIEKKRAEYLHELSKTNEILEKLFTAENDSIIDVTGQDYIITPPAQNITTPEQYVPYWRHQYVYSYSEINSATPEQIKFYRYFKQAFLSGTHLNLEGNTNYAFILLFDLLDNDYAKHKDLVRLENELNELGFHYPKTQSYATSFLIKKMEAAGDYAGVERLRGNIYQSSYQSNYGYDYWRLGNKFKTKLNLTDKEVVLLNRLWDPGNNFCSIEFCLLEVLKLYLATIMELESIYTAEGTTLADSFNNVSDIIARKYFRYRKNSENYKYNLETTTNELYALVFKHCENTVREHYGHKRKLSTDITYTTNPEVASVLEEKITTKVKDIHPRLLSTINQPDVSTEIELNIRNTSRWKPKFEEIAADFKGADGKQFVKDIQTLGILNQKNPSLENIYFEASKFITKTDPEAALILYLHYLHADLQSVTFNNKQLAKTVQKSLFKTQEQLQGFELIIKDLIKDKNLEKAVQALSDLYAPKRKKIQLNTQMIKEVQQQHSSTVELLNGYLQDEEEAFNAKPIETLANTEGVEVSFQNLVLEQKDDFFVDGLLLDNTQRDLLRLFFDNDFSVPKREVENFSKANGLMRNQLIDSINDSCQEQLDDVLIEEDDEHYTIYDNYFQKLIKK